MVQSRAQPHSSCVAKDGYSMIRALPLFIPNSGSKCGNLYFSLSLLRHSLGIVCGVDHYNDDKPNIVNLSSFIYNDFARYQIKRYGYHFY